MKHKNIKGGVPVGHSKCILYCTKGLHGNCAEILHYTYFLPSAVSQELHECLHHCLQGIQSNFYILYQLGNKALTLSGQKKKVNGPGSASYSFPIV